MSPLEFVVFLAVVSALYYLVPRKWQSAVLLCANIFYCLTVSVLCLLTLLGVTANAFFSSIVIKRNRKEQSCGECNREHIKKRRALILGLVAILFSFVLSRVLTLFVGAPSAQTGGGAAALLGDGGGIGLAFYSLAAAGYLIDVYRGKIERERSFLRLFLFVGFFPCIRLGPISRYHDLAPQFLSPHAPTWGNITSGGVRILWGYFKKLVVADTALVALNNMVSAPHKYSGGYAFFLIILYSVVIYADFTGGIDVSLGASKMLGITLAENFDRPFSSNSVREYWKRWHITLGAFFSDYVFYPLSISKPMQRLSKRLRKSRLFGGAKRVPIYIALVATWILTGAWHSLASNHILWGFTNAAVIIAAQEISSARTRRQRKSAAIVVAARAQQCQERVTSATAAPKSTPAARRLCAVRTFFIIGAIRLFDLWSDPMTAMRAVASIFLDFGGWTSFFSGGILSLGLATREWIVIICGIAIMFVVSKANFGEQHRVQRILDRHPFATCACAAFLTLSITIFGSYGIGFEASSFIYSKF